MKLHWSPKSPYVRKVMICIDELGIKNDVELVRSVAAMLKPNPDIMVDNPLSKIPTLVTGDGLPLFDSSVICEYLNDFAKGPLFPASGQARWQALRMQSFANGLLDILILWRNEREREHPLQTLIDAFDVKAQASIRQLETEVDALSKKQFDIGHATLCCALGYADYRFESFDWRSAAPELAKWYAQMRERPSVKATEPAEG